MSRSTSRGGSNKNKNDNPRSASSHYDDDDDDSIGDPRDAVMMSGGASAVYQQEESQHNQCQEPSSTGDYSITGIGLSLSNNNLSASYIFQSSVRSDMSGDLQAIMERRRRIADGGSGHDEDNENDDHDHVGGGTGQSNDHKDNSNNGNPNNNNSDNSSGMVLGDDSAVINLSRNDSSDQMMKDLSSCSNPPSNGRNNNNNSSPKSSSSNNKVKPVPMSPDLKVIMERRRKLARGGADKSDDDDDDDHIYKHQTSGEDKAGTHRSTAAAGSSHSGGHSSATTNNSSRSGGGGGGSTRTSRSSSRSGRNHQSQHEDTHHHQQQHASEVGGNVPSNGDSHPSRTTSANPIRKSGSSGNVRKSRRRTTSNNSGSIADSSDEVSVDNMSVGNNESGAAAKGSSSRSSSRHHSSSGSATNSHHHREGREAGGSRSSGSRRRSAERDRDKDRERDKSSDHHHHGDRSVSRPHKEKSSSSRRRDERTTSSSSSRDMPSSTSAAASSSSRSRRSTGGSGTSSKHRSSRRTASATGASTSVDEANSTNDHPIDSSSAIGHPPRRGSENGRHEHGNNSNSHQHDENTSSSSFPLTRRKPISRKESTGAHSMVDADRARHTTKSSSLPKTASSASLPRTFEEQQHRRERQFAGQQLEQEQQQELQQQDEVATATSSSSSAAPQPSQEDNKIDDKDDDHVNNNRGNVTDSDEVQQSISDFDEIRRSRPEQPQQKGRSGKIANATHSTSFPPSDFPSFPTASSSLAKEDSGFFGKEFKANFSATAETAPAVKASSSGASNNPGGAATNGAFGNFADDDGGVMGFPSSSDAGAPPSSDAVFGMGGGTMTDPFGGMGLETTTTTMTTTTSTTNDAFSGDAFGFGVANFDPKDDIFGSGPKGDTNNSSSIFGSEFETKGAFDIATSAFESPAVPTEPVWDKTVLSNVPKRPVKKLGLLPRTVFIKPFQGSPVTNPLTNNIIFCSSACDTVYLHEVDPRRDNVQVACASVLSLDLRRKIATKYNVSVHKVDSVLTLTAGLHSANGKTRVRVAAIMDLEVLESSQLMRVVTVWQWGYASPHPISLQYVMTPPSGGDFSYDSTTLQVADGLLFIAGSSPKSPCVFMCKPTVRETWSVNFLTGHGRVSAMAITPDLRRTCPYLAIALTDRSVSLWTYGSALGGPTAGGGGGGGGRSSESSKKWLFPLCRMDCAAALSSVEASSPCDDGNVAGGRDPKDIGYCTCLVWTPQQSSVASLQMIAVGFQNGLAVFHVRLPLSSDKSRNVLQPLREPTEATQLPQTPMLQPIVAKRWLGKHEASSVSWIDVGPHVNPCLAVLLHASDRGGTARISMGTINFHTYRKGPVSNDRFVPFNLFASTNVARNSESYPTGLLRSSGRTSVMGFSSERLLSMALSSSASSPYIPDAVIASLRHPIASYAPGLTSSADILLGDTTSNKDGILHVFTVLQCERRKNSADPTLSEWARPLRRHYLCRTVVGDTKETSPGEDKKKEDRGFGESEEETGGAISDVICDLCDDSLIGLAPFRIVRCEGSNLCAVLFRAGLCSKSEKVEPPLLDASSIAFVDYSDAVPCFKVVAGRDIAFFPTKGGAEPTGLILSRDGSSLSYFEWQSNARECKLLSSFRPILGSSEEEDDFVDCRRVFAFYCASKVGLFVVGTRIRDSQTCLVTGDLCGLAEVTPDSWSMLLPNLTTGRSIWLAEDEEVFSAIGLEGDESGYRNFAVATCSRMLILSSAMTIAAEEHVELSCLSLAPLGSFAVCFSTWDKVRYLCCLDGAHSSGVVASLPSSIYGQASTLLLAVRPDRHLLVECHAAIRLVESGQNADIFQLPTAVTRPALLLEPMIANAICVGGMMNQSTPVLRTVIEKFGRKVASITHGENEGIGRFGSGITSKVFEMLDRHGLKHAASWLLTGAVQFKRAANSTILPHWLPVAPKARGGLNSDALLHIIASGDQYLSDYLKSPEQNMPSTLPRQSDPSAFICREHAGKALDMGKANSILKMLDMVGSEASESLIVQLALVLEKDSKNKSMGVLKAVSGYDDNGIGRSTRPVKAPASLAALAVSLKKKKKNNAGVFELDDSEVDRWMKPLAPSLQRGSRTGRIRQRLLGEQVLVDATGKVEETSDPLWVSPCNESKHVWNEGPRKEKEKLLLLDTPEDWLGRRRPLILGKEGASAIRDRGEKTLADILNQDEEDSFGAKSDLGSEEKDGWVDGVGEGRSDEANLSGYFRMSEGDDEDSPWKQEGLVDLSPYQNKAMIVGDVESFSLQPSTSSVDEGEPGKVKSLYDLVFETSSIGAASGLSLSAVRGGSLDVGVLHGPSHSSRKKCSIEFWFFLPSAEALPDEMILARRTMGATADDLSKVCLLSDRDSVLWELTLRKKTRELEFRTCGGSSLLSSQSYDGYGADEANDDGDDDDDDDADNVKERSDLAIFERWNHVCIVLSSRGPAVADCFVSLQMKGKEVASAETSMLPHGHEEDDLESSSTLNDIMQKSHLLFGLNHCAGYRLTELRFWACERSADDTQSFLYEYLTAAEAKKKFKVKITGKNKRTGGLAKGGGLLAPPKASDGSMQPRGFIATTKSGLLGPPKSLLAPKQENFTPTPGKLSLAPPPKEPQKKGFLSPPPDTVPEEPPDRQEVNNAGFEAAFSSFGDGALTQTQQQEQGMQQRPPQPHATASGFLVVDESPLEEGMQQTDDQDELDVPTTLWDTAIPLSQQVRSSAAAALIRGPPATRHFGGNRGGLPDFSGMERYGVGGVAICGSEKTIVFRDNEDPPALTYPIGASGAVVSDQMDDEGSEFLCCFLARERRMVVFELQSRTVVVELQMTTKLNFWRYLPPESAENTLCFMLVTPVGGFHWMPLEESPRPHQVWKRGPDLQGKKVVCYEEGGSNGLEGSDIRSRVGLVMVTRAAGAGFLEGWIIPIGGDSKASQVSDDIMGACLCQPPFVDDGPFLPLLVTVHYVADNIYVNVLSVMEPSKGSVAVGELEVTRVVDMSGYEDVDFDPPALAMGTFPEAICCSLANIIVVIIRRKGLIAAFELEDDDMSLIAQEGVDHYVVDAVMRYSAEVGGAEIVMLLADNENSKDGRMVSFCFRSAA